MKMQIFYCSVKKSKKTVIAKNLKVYGNIQRLEGRGRLTKVVQESGEMLIISKMQSEEYYNTIFS